MPVSIHVTRGGDRDWGDAPLRDIEAVCKSVVKCFAVFDQEAVTITVSNMSEGPQARKDPSFRAGEELVWVSVEGRVWAQLAFQFAHEFWYERATRAGC